MEKWGYSVKGVNYLNERTDILYCSKECAVEDGSRESDLVLFSGKQYAATYKPVYGEEEVTQSEHGCLCPVCEEEYHGIDLVE